MNESTHWALLLLAWMAPSYALYFYSDLNNWPAVIFGFGLLGAFLYHARRLLAIEAVARGDGQ